MEREFDKISKFRIFYKYANTDIKLNMSKCEKGLLVFYKNFAQHTQKLTSN